MRVVGCVIISLLFSFLGLVAQDSVKHKPFRILPVPTFGYQPETRTYVGAVALATLDFYKDETRTSNASLEFTYTWNKQLIVEGDWNYFFRDEAWLTSGRLHFSKYPDLYYGIGNDTRASESYDSKRITNEVYLLKRVGKKIFLGAQLRYFSFSDISQVIKPPSPLILPNENRQVGSIGLSFLVDRRNNILSPSKGSFAQVDITQNFSSSNYQKYIVDLRKYWTFKAGITVAARSYFQSNSGDAVPFFDLAHMGGDRFTRGFFYGRYRDKHFHTLQTECRALVFWRIGVAGFGGVSRVFASFNDFALSGYRYNIGGGLRILVDKQEGTSLRLDYAIGQDGNSGFYFAFGEAF